MPKVKPLLRDELKKAAAVMLAEGQPLVDIANAVSVDVRTIHRWRKHDDEFRTAFSKELYEMQQQSIATLHAKLDSVTKVLVGIAEDENAKNADRLKACEMIYKLTSSYHDQEDFRRRLAIVDAINQYRNITVDVEAEEAS